MQKIRNGDTLRNTSWEAMKADGTAPATGTGLDPPMGEGKIIIYFQYFWILTKLYHRIVAKMKNLRQKTSRTSRKNGRNYPPFSSLTRARPGADIKLRKTTCGWQPPPPSQVLLLKLICFALCLFCKDLGPNHAQTLHAVNDFFLASLHTRQSNSVVNCAEDR